MYLLVDNSKISKLLETTTSKIVLILGRFSQPRKQILDAIKANLQQRGYIPVEFDFTPTTERNFRDTVRFIANMCGFVIADLTDPKIVLQELEAIKAIEVPVQPILLQSEKIHTSYDADFRNIGWFLPVHRYKDEADLLNSIDTAIIAPAKSMAAQLHP